MRSQPWISSSRSGFSEASAEARPRTGLRSRAFHSWARSTEAPAVFKAYISMYDPARADSIRYVRIDDSVYNGLRKIAAGIDDEILQTKK